MFSTWIANSSSLILIKSLPSKILSYGIPTFSHIALVTKALSPVKILISTPRLCNSLIAASAESLGGSKKVKYPIKVISFSSFIENFPTGAASFLEAIAITRIPSSENSSTFFKTFFIIGLVKSKTLPSWYIVLQTPIISSTAPFVIILIRLFFKERTNTDILLRLKSKGNSSIFSKCNSKLSNDFSSSANSKVLLIIDLSNKFLSPVW